MASARLAASPGLKRMYYCVEEKEEEEESLFNRKYMVWETSIKTTYGRWHRGHPYHQHIHEIIYHVFS